jgi:phytoene/squalene synthetase
MARFGVTEDQVTSFRFDENFRRLMQFEVDRTQKMFEEGQQLLPLLAPVYRRQISLFGQGGRAILRAIERRGYDTLSARPRLSAFQKGRLIARALGAAVMQKLTPATRGTAR